MLSVVFCVVGTFFLFSFIHFAAKKKKPFKRAILSMFLGGLTLCCVDLLAGLTGVYIPLTVLTVCVSVAGGVPGVALLTLLSAF